ncbi:hypothetical protein VTO42DRAFT_8522 [Malbranchea cinnamomea]
MSTLSTSLSSFTSFPPPGRQRKMSLTQTYFLAHTARAKLSREAQRPDHNLRLLVGHANMLDSLMIELAEAEREQEKWFNHSVRRASSASPESRHIQWADKVAQTAEDDWHAEDTLSDSDSDSDGDGDGDDSDYSPDERVFVDVSQSTPPAPTVTVTPVTFPRTYDDGDDDDEDYDEDEYEDDLEEDYEELALTRTNSHSHQPPELLSDDDSDEEELSPPSPPQPTFDHFSHSDGSEEAIVPSPFYASKPSTPAPSKLALSESNQASLLDREFYLPPQGTERLVEAY